MNRPGHAAVRQADQASILPLYRRGIAGCRRRDAREASEALAALILMLNFEYEEAAGELFGLYDLCLRKVRAGRFDVAGQILHDLEAAWTASRPVR